MLPVRGYEEGWSVRFEGITPDSVRLPGGRVRALSLRRLPVRSSGGRFLCKGHAVTGVFIHAGLASSAGIRRAGASHGGGGAPAPRISWTAARRPCERTCRRPQAPHI